MLIHPCIFPFLETLFKLKIIEIIFQALLKIIYELNFLIITIYIIIYKFSLIYFLIKFKIYNYIWGLGIGDWGLGIGDWAQSPIPNPQSPIPNPQLEYLIF